MFCLRNIYLFKKAKRLQTKLLFWTTHGSLFLYKIFKKLSKSRFVPELRWLGISLTNLTSEYKWILIGGQKKRWCVNKWLILFMEHKSALMGIILKYVTRLPNLLLIRQIVAWYVSQVWDDGLLKLTGAWEDFWLNLL